MNRDKWKSVCKGLNFTAPDHASCNDGWSSLIQDTFHKLNSAGFTGTVSQVKIVASNSREGSSAKVQRPSGSDRNWSAWGQKLDRTGSKRQSHVSPHGSEVSSQRLPKRGVFRSGMIPTHNVSGTRNSSGTLKTVPPSV